MSLRCEFCRSRRISEPCIKLPGPRTAARVAPSRPLPTPIDAVIRDEDVVLLEYAFSLDDGLTYKMSTALFKLIRSQYGSTIQQTSLRQAMLAWCAYHLRREEFRSRGDEHKRQATSALIHNLDSSTVINDADIFATWILMEIAALNGSPREVLTHANGCQSFLRCALEKSNKRQPSDLLKVFAAFLFDYVACMATRLYVCPTVYSVPNPSSTPVSLPQRQTSFGQRVKYWDEICRSSLHSKEYWCSGVIKAVHETLGDIIGILAPCWGEYLLRELANNFRRDTIVRDVLLYVRAELDDPDLQRALTDLGVWGKIRGQMISQDFATQLVIYQSRRLEWIALATMILEAPSVLRSLDLPEVGLKAISLVSFYRSESSRLREGPMNDYCLCRYPQTLLLAGWALPLKEGQERKSSTFCKNLLM